MKIAVTAVVLLLSGLLAVEVQKSWREPNGPAPLSPTVPFVREPRIVRAFPITWVNQAGSASKVAALLRDLSPDPSVKLALDEEHHQVIALGSDQQLALVASVIKEVALAVEPGHYVARVRRLELVKGDSLAPEIDARLADMKGPLLTLAKEVGFSKIALVDDVQDVGRPWTFIARAWTKGSSGGYYHFNLNYHRVIYLVPKGGKDPDSDDENTCGQEIVYDYDRGTDDSDSQEGSHIVYNPAIKLQDGTQSPDTACIITVTRWKEPAP